MSCEKEIEMVDNRIAEHLWGFPFSDLVVVTVRNFSYETWSHIKSSYEQYGWALARTQGWFFTTIYMVRINPEYYWRQHAKEIGSSNSD